MPDIGTAEQLDLEKLRVECTNKEQELSDDEAYIMSALP